MNNPLPFEPLLILTPTRAGLSPEFQANLAQLPGAIPIFHPGESDISQARQIVATLAEEFLQSANPRAQAVRFVLWLDDDMQALPETVAAHMALLERSGLEAISGRYVQRRAAALAAVLNPDDDGKPVVLEADDGRGNRVEFLRVWAGLGALMLTRRAFLRVCGEALWSEKSPDGRSRRLVCSSSIETLPDGRGRYWPEDFDFCRRVGDVWLGPLWLRYGHKRERFEYPNADSAPRLG